MKPLHMKPTPIWLQIQAIASLNMYISMYVWDICCVECLFLWLRLSFQTLCILCILYSWIFASCKEKKWANSQKRCRRPAARFGPTGPQTVPPPTPRSSFLLKKTPKITSGIQVCVFPSCVCLYIYLINV